MPILPFVERMGMKISYPTYFEACILFCNSSFTLYLSFIHRSPHSCKWYKNRSSAGEQTMPKCRQTTWVMSSQGSLCRRQCAMRRRCSPLSRNGGKTIFSFGLWASSWLLSLRSLFSSLVASSSPWWTLYLSWRLYFRFLRRLVSFPCWTGWRERKFPQVGSAKKSPFFQSRLRSDSLLDFTLRLFLEKLKAVVFEISRTPSRPVPKRNCSEKIPFLLELLERDWIAVDFGNAKEESGKDLKLHPEGEDWTTTSVS